MSLNLKVNIDANSGFCFGVVKAIQKVEEALQDGGKVYCLGHIVHNSMEVGRLEKLGMTTINHDELKKIHDKTILIRAHGEPPATYELMKQNNNQLIEATCPVVLKLQNRIRKTHNEGDFILIFGNRNHPEVKGLIGQSPDRVRAFERIDDLDLSELPKHLVLYSQTTKDQDALYSVFDELKKRGFDVVLQDTVCRQVSGRKNELQKFALENDVVIMVAGFESSNGKVLHAHCKAVNENSYKVARVEDIKTEWFNPNQKVGVGGATSTPQWLMDQVAEYLRSL